MIKDISFFLLRLVLFSLILLAVHYYILIQFFSGELYFPLWTIYCFNAAMAFGVYSALRYYSEVQPQNILRIFLLLTLLKMVLAVVFLLPLFLKKSDHVQLEVFNFFIPYFLFLIFEIFGLSKFLQKS
ncbi:MAG: hypothetical protein AAF361_04190 [Bacteroidota bacterium]